MKIENFTLAIHKALKAPQIILFGSRYMGTERDNSDIDLLVLSDDFYNVGLWERNKLVEQARIDLDWHADIFCRTPAEWERDTKFNRMIRSQFNQRDDWRRLFDTLGRKTTYAELTRWLRGEPVVDCGCSRRRVYGEPDKKDAAPD